MGAGRPSGPASKALYVQGCFVPALAELFVVEGLDKQYHVAADIAVLHVELDKQQVLVQVVAAVVRHLQRWHLACFDLPINHLPVVQNMSTRQASDSIWHYADLP